MSSAQPVIAELPETIPSGEYVVIAETDNEGPLVIQFNRSAGCYVLPTTNPPDLTFAQVRHLLSMPGRPHDDRLDGPEVTYTLPEVPDA